MKKEDLMPRFTGKTVEEALAKATGRQASSPDPNAALRTRCEQIQARAQRAAEELAEQLERLNELERSISDVERRMERGAVVAVASMIPGVRLLVTRGRGIRRLISKIQRNQPVTAADLGEVAAVVGGLGGLVSGIASSYANIPERDRLLQQATRIQQAAQVARNRFNVEIDSFNRSNCPLLLNGRSHGIGRIRLSR